MQVISQDNSETIFDANNIAVRLKQAN